MDMPKYHLGLLKQEIINILVSLHITYLFENK